MTRQEAIAVLKENAFTFCDPKRCVDGYSNWICEECHEACNKAIEELEKETVSRETYDYEFNLRKMFEMKIFELENNMVKPSEDCISREWVLDKIHAYADADTTNTGESVGADYCAEFVKNAPSVVPTTEQPQMLEELKWESEDVCKNCGYKIPHLEKIIGDVVLMDSKYWEYCPNCGGRRR